MLLAIFVSPASPQALDSRKDCSEKAKKLLEEAWKAQPMNVDQNDTNPGRAESLYKEAITDSPKCRPAMRLLVNLLLRRKKYEEANYYNESFLKQFPDDPSGLSEKAELVSLLKKDYALALEIEMKLLSVPDFNKNGNVFYRIARTYSLMNNLDDSLAYLKQAVSIDRGWVDKANAQSDSGFENVRKDKRFWQVVNEK